MKVKEAISQLQRFDGELALLTGIDGDRTIYSFAKCSYPDSDGEQDYVNFILMRSGI